LHAKNAAGRLDAPVNIGEAFEIVRGILGRTAAAQTALAELMLKQLCPALALEQSVHQTTTEVVASAAQSYKACKRSLSALQSIKRKFPDASSEAVDSLQSSFHDGDLPASHPPGAGSSEAVAETSQRVSITCNRPVAAAAAAAARDIDAFLKNLDAIHFIHCNSNARISKVVQSAHAAMRELNAPPAAPASLSNTLSSSCSSPACQDQMPLNYAKSDSLNLGQSSAQPMLIFKPPRAVPK
jgi:hypothetical protein